MHKILRKCLSLLIALSLLMSCICTTINATDESFFTFTYLDGVYQATLDTTKDLSSVIELTLPAKYDDNVNGEADVVFFKATGPTSGNDSIVTFSTASSKANMVRRAFRYLNALTTVNYTNTGILVFPERTFENCSSTLTSVYIYATTVQISHSSAFMNFISNNGAKIYVTSNEVKNQIVEGTASGSYPVPENMIEVMTLETPKSECKLSSESENTVTKYGTALNPSVTVTVNGTKVENPTVTYQLYTDEACTTAYNGYPYNSTMLPIGTYYLRASVAGTEDYQGSVSNVVKVEVSKNEIDQKLIDALNNAITEANNFKEVNAKEDYDSEAWDNVFSTSVSTSALPQAQLVAIDIAGGLITEVRVGEVTEALNKALDALKSAVIDPVDEKAALQNLIDDAKALDKDNYTADSYKALTDELAKAEDVLVTTKVTKTQVTNAAKALQTAIDNLLEVKPGEENDYVNLQGTWKKQGGADNKMNSLKADTKYSLGDWWIEITNMDLSGMINPTLEVTYEANGDTTQISANKSGSTSGTDAWDITITSGRDGSGVSTYSLDKEIKNLFITSNGNTMVYKKIRVFDAATDFTALDEAIKEAEAVDQSKYTDETVNALTQAIESGKAVRENAEATQTDADEATKAINNAISKLTEKPAEPSKSSVTPSNPTKPTTKPVATTAPTTRSSEAVAKDKKAAEKAMKQAKIKKLKVKSKAKKKINVTWKKVKKAKGYQVQVATKKTFKDSKIIFDKLTKKKTLKITNKKIKSGKTYYVRVRAYAVYNDKNGEAIKVYSKWNKVLRKVKVK